MIRFKLVSLGGVKFDEDVYEVVMPTKAGEVAIFKDHMPMISSAKEGVISVRRKAGDSNADMEHFATAGGLIEVDGQTVSFLADDIVSADEVNESEAQMAIDQAKKRISQAKDKVELSEAQQLLARSSARLQVAKLKKRHHN